jgi:uncharacterized protein (UPF0210 family)
VSIKVVGPVNEEGNSEIRRLQCDSSFSELARLSKYLFQMEESEVVGFATEAGGACDVIDNETLATVLNGASSPKLFLKVLGTVATPPAPPLGGNQEGIKVRALTHFIVLTKDSRAWEGIIVKAATLINQVANTCAEAGYVVQTLRIVCNPFSEFLDMTSTDAALGDVQAIKEVLTGPSMPAGKLRIRFALGAANDAADLKLVPVLIQHFADLANCCINIPADEFGLPDPVLTQAAAECCQTLATVTPTGGVLGEGNFNFTANFNMAPGCPYFPAGYNTTKAGASFAIGLEYPDLIVKVLSEQVAKTASWTDKYKVLNAAIQVHTKTLEGICYQASKGSGLRFAGFDTSAAPAKDVSR